MIYEYEGRMVDMGGQIRLLWNGDGWTNADARYPRRLVATTAFSFF